jgi:hypothetical protein
VGKFYSLNTSQCGYFLPRSHIMLIGMNSSKGIDKLLHLMFLYKQTDSNYEFQLEIYILLCL